MNRRIDICVCTFRRPHVIETLASLHAQNLPHDVAARVLVIDNDDTPTAKAWVAQAAGSGPIPIDYMHRPGRNISLARNAALEASDARFLAFIDDDERAGPNWVAALLARQEQTGAEIVLGPVRAVYPPNAPDWMQRANLHSTRPVWVKGTIRTGYSCNVLMDRQNEILAQARFDLDFGRTGGEDTLFFSTLHDAGIAIDFAAEASIDEPVAAERLNRRWLMQRRFRMGQTHANLLCRRDNHTPQAAATLAATKALICFAKATATLPLPAISVPAQLRGWLHAGVVAGLMGRPAKRLYGGSP
ncbi:MAG: glycosyltransferase family 2 protein [Pseudomonadota bacterium]